MGELHQPVRHAVPGGGIVRSLVSEADELGNALGNAHGGPRVVGLGALSLTSIEREVQTGAVG